MGVLAELGKPKAGQNQDKPAGRVLSRLGAPPTTGGAGGSFNVNTLEGARQLASSKGIEAPKRSLTSGLLGGLGKTIDVLRTGEFAVGGLLAGEGAREGIKKKISPSTALFGEGRPDTTLGRFALGATKLATDVLLDPTTYLTLGTGSAVKVTVTGGRKIAVSKTGKQLLKDLAEEVAINSKVRPDTANLLAREKIGKLVGKEATTLEARGGLEMVTRALRATGQEVTRESVELAMKQGVSGLSAKTGLKFAGKEIVSASTLKFPFSATTEFMVKNLGKTESGKDFMRGVESMGKSFRGLANRDFDIPETFIPDKQKFIDSFDNAQSRIKHNIFSVFSGVSKAEREAISIAMEAKEEGIKNLPEHLRPLVKRVKKIFEHTALEEEKRQLLNNTLNDYIPHIYKNREKAKTLLADFKSGSPSAILRFSKERTIPSIREAEALGLEPIKDIAEILYIRLLASEKAKLTQDFFSKTALKHGVQETIQGVKIKIIPLKVKEIITTTKIPISAGKFVSENVQKILPKEILSDRTSVKAIDESVEILSRKIREIKLAISRTENNLRLAGTNTKAVEFLGKLATKSLVSDNLRVLKESTRQLTDLRKQIAILKKPSSIKETTGFVKIKTITPKLRPEKRIIYKIKQTNPELARKILDSGENYVRFGDVGTGIPKQFREMQIPANIAKDIASMNKEFFNDEGANALLRAFDKAQNFFKGSVTVLFPSFHGRNAISNTLLNSMDIGLQAFNPKVWRQAVDIMSGKEGKFITDLGEEYSFKQMRKLMREHQVFQDRLARTDVGRTLESNVLKREGVFGLGGRVGRAIENEGRMINFITNIRRGYDPSDAAARTKQFLFDYDNLSDFEKAMMRRMIPFYTFTRKNIALQLNQLVTNPKSVITPLKAFQSLSDSMALKMNEDEKQFAPNFVLQGLRVLIERKGDDRTFLIGFDLPMEDAFEKLNRPIKSAMSMLSPFLKAPLELATGKNFFTERNIKDDDSGTFAEKLPTVVKEWLDYSERQVINKEGREFTLRKVDPTKKWIFQNVASMIGIGRASNNRTLQQLSAFHTMLKGEEKITLEERFDMISFFTGIRSTTINIESEKAKVEKEETRKLQDILERKGEIGVLQRAFIPKDKK
jgi:hypothetical protein